MSDDDKIAEIKARHKAGPLGQMPREDRMSNFLRWQWLLGEVDRRGAEIEKQRAEIERFREALTDIANQETTGPYKWQLVVARLCEIAREALEGRP